MHLRQVGFGCIIGMVENDRENLLIGVWLFWLGTWFAVHVLDRISFKIIPVDYRMSYVIVIKMGLCWSRAAVRRVGRARAVQAARLAWSAAWRRRVRVRRFTRTHTPRSRPRSARPPRLACMSTSATRARCVWTEFTPGGVVGTQQITWWCAELQVKERREKFLTAKYGSHQMALIRKRLAVEMWLYDELQKLYEPATSVSFIYTLKLCTSRTSADWCIGHFGVILGNFWKTMATRHCMKCLINYRAYQSAKS